MNFIALSIKTANQWPDSICAIQLTKIEDCKVVNTLSTYIHTTQDFDPFYVAQHGIEQTDVQHAPTFDEFSPILQNWLHEQTVLSFYEPYESLCLTESYESINKLCPTFQHFSILPYLKSTLTSLQSYSLHAICTTLEIPEQVTDADYIAQLVIKTMPEQTDWKKLLQKQIQRQAEPLVSLMQKTIIFTGALNGIRRSEAAKLVMRAGGLFSNTMSKKVDILVISQKSLDKFHFNEQQSSKWRNAIQLQQQGYAIEIITEEQFLQFIHS